MVLQLLIAEVRTQACRAPRRCLVALLLGGDVGRFACLRRPPRLRLCVDASHMKARRRQRPEVPRAMRASARSISSMRGVRRSSRRAYISHFPPQPLTQLLRQLVAELRHVALPMLIHAHAPPCAMALGAIDTPGWRDGCARPCGRSLAPSPPKASRSRKLAAQHVMRTSVDEAALPERRAPVSPTFRDRPRGWGGGAPPFSPPEPGGRPAGPRFGSVRWWFRRARRRPWGRR
jgi:hypothetical protein